MSQSVQDFIETEIFPWQHAAFERLSEITEAGLVPKIVMHPRGGWMLIGVQPESPAEPSSPPPTEEAE